MAWFQLNHYSLTGSAFYFNRYDLAFLGTIFIGLTFALQLWFTPRVKQDANRFLALAVIVMVLWMVRILAIDLRLETCLPHFLLALGPLVYFYVLKITGPEYKFRYEDLKHFVPLLLQQGVMALEIRESIRTGAATYDTLIFKQLNPILLLLAAISVITYLYLSHQLIERFYQMQKFNDRSDRYRFGLRWLHRLLVAFGFFWLLWILLLVVDYFYFHQKLDVRVYYPLYLLLAAMMIRIAAEALSRPEVALPAPAPAVSKLPPAAALKQQGIWLKKAVEVIPFYDMF